MGSNISPRGYTAIIIRICYRKEALETIEMLVDYAAADGKAECRHNGDTASDQGKT